MTKNKMHHITASCESPSGYRFGIGEKCWMPFKMNPIARFGRYFFLPLIFLYSVCFWGCGESESENSKALPRTVSEPQAVSAGMAALVVLPQLSPNSSCYSQQILLQVTSVDGTTAAQALIAPVTSHRFEINPGTYDLHVSTVGMMQAGCAMSYRLELSTGQTAQISPVFP